MRRTVLVALLLICAKGGARTADAAARQHLRCAREFCGCGQVRLCDIARPAGLLSALQHPRREIDLTLRGYLSVQEASIVDSIPAAGVLPPSARPLLLRVLTRFVEGPDARTRFEAAGGGAAGVEAALGLVQPSDPPPVANRVLLEAAFPTAIVAAGVPVPRGVRRHGGLATWVYSSPQCVIDVDRVTGKVSDLVYRAVDLLASESGLGDSTSAVQADAIAHAWLAERGVSTADWQIAEAVTMGRGQNVEYRVRWERRLPNGVTAPAVMTVQVTGTGAVRGFHRMDRPVSIDTSRGITEQQAILQAIEATADPHATATSSRRAVRLGDDGRQVLVWLVDVLTGATEAKVELDALTGTVRHVARPLSDARGGPEIARDQAIASEASRALAAVVAMDVLVRADQPGAPLERVAANVKPVGRLDGAPAAALGARLAACKPLAYPVAPPVGQVWLCCTTSRPGSGVWVGIELLSGQAWVRCSPTHPQQLVDPTARRIVVQPEDRWRVDPVEPVAFLALPRETVAQVISLVDDQATQGALRRIDAKGRRLEHARAAQQHGSGLLVWPKGRVLPLCAVVVLLSLLHIARAGWRRNRRQTVHVG